MPVLMGVVLLLVPVVLEALVVVKPLPLVRMVVLRPPVATPRPRPTQP